MIPPPKRIAVQDANVLIDLELAGLFDLWFQTGIETHTTDLIRGELEKGGHSEALAWFESGHVILHRLSFEDLLVVSELEREIGSKAKFNDCSVIFLARKIGAMLISGDKALRKGGKAQNIEVHGALWIFDLLVARGILPPHIAAAKLEHLRHADRYFPENECLLRLERWWPAR
jgi:hypothetical protein